MASDPGPMLGRRRLRAALRRARESAGLTQEQVAGAMDWSLSKVIRIEAGHVSVSTNDVKALMAHYRIAGAAQASELVALARASRRRMWWAAYRDKVPAGQLAFVGLEAEATAMLMFPQLGVPSLLQTEDYAYAFIAAGSPAAPDRALVAQRVEFQLRRQREIFARTTPPTIRVVLDEVHLHRRYGGAAVLRRQLEHLLDLATQQAVTIQVLPLSIDDWPAFRPFTLLEFPEEDDVVCQDATENLLLLDQPESTAPFRERFARLWALSLSSAESVATLEKRVQELATVA